jgi:hypothetical protein
VAEYVVKDENGDVVNVVVWDGASDWSPAEGHTVEPLEEQPEDFVFVAPEVIPDLAPDPVLSADEIAARVAALQAAIDVLVASQGDGQAG